MAADLSLPLKFVERLTRAASHFYQEYSIPKRSGGTRLIHHPAKTLKALQRWLQHNLLSKLPIHDAAMAYRRGISIRENAQPHAQGRYLLRMDFQEFFESITAIDVERYLDAQRRLLEGLFSGWSADDVETVCALVCRKGTLTIGAPTSPGLSNAICFPLDEALSTAAKRSSVIYTRYADDLFFSAVRPGVLRDLEAEVKKVVSALPYPARLRVNATKTRHSSRKRTRRVTGLTLGSDGQVHLGRSVKRRVRSLLYCLPRLKAKERNYLRGLIAFSIGIDPGFLNALVIKYGDAVVKEARKVPPPGLP